MTDTGMQQPDPTQAAMVEEEGLVQLTDALERKPWYHNAAWIDLLSLGIAALSLSASVFLSVWLFLLRETDARIERTIGEIDRTYDPAFSQALLRLVDRAYPYYQDPAKAGLSRDERFRRYWDKDDTQTDPDMFLLTTRLNAIQLCYAHGDCDRTEMRIRFPLLVYESLFFLRDFLFLDPKLQAEADQGALDAWWLSPQVYDFLADYCVWAKESGREVTLWSRRDELLRDPSARTLDPCLPPRPR